jgi:hypothetical protein
VLPHTIAQCSVGRLTPPVEESRRHHNDTRDQIAALPRRSRSQDLFACQIVASGDDPCEESERTSAYEINCGIVADFGRKIEACESIHESKIDAEN